MMFYRPVPPSAGPAWLLGLTLLVPTPRISWAQSPEQLFEAGAYRAAADSFAMRVGAEPRVSEHWFNLGDALYRVGDEVGARAAWIRAARLKPRGADARFALSLLPPTDPVTRALTPVEPFTPAEAWLIAAVLWLVGWGLVALRARWRLVLLPLLLAGAATAWGFRTASRYAEPVALVRRANTPLRQAPYGTAPAKRAVNDGAALVVTGVQGSWVLVRRGADLGWMLASEVVPL